MAKADLAQANFDRVEELKGLAADLRTTVDGADDEIAAADKNGEAKDYFQGKLADFGLTLNSIDKDIENLEGDAIYGESNEEKYDSIKQSISDNKGYVDQLIKDAAENRANYEELLGEKYDLQELWNTTYEDINGRPDSETKDEYLKKLDGIQDEINAVAGEINAAYKDGQLTFDEFDKSAKTEELKDKITEIKKKLESFDEGYDEAIAKENADMNDAFKKAIALTDEAYEKAVKEIDSYRGVENDELMAAIEEIVVKYHDEFYLFNADGTANENPYRQQIQTLKDDARQAYEETKSPNTLSDEYVKKANDLTEEIENKIKDLQADIQTVVDAFWATKKADFDQKVADAEAIIAGYAAKAKKDAFKDVKDIITKADGYAENATAENINKLSDELDKLANIDDMLAEDVNNAAKKDIDPRIKAANDNYDAAKKKVEGEYLNQLNDLYNTTVQAAQDLENEAYADKSLADNRQDILDLLAGFDYQTIIDNYNAAKQAAEDLAEAIEDLNKQLDEAIEKLEQFLDGDDDIADLEALRDEIEALTEAGDSATVAAKIETIVNDAIDEEQKLMQGMLEELQEQYNRFASENPDEAKEAADMRAMIEAARNAAYNDAATADDIIEAEKALADLNSGLNPEADGAAKNELENAIEDLKTEAKLEGVSDEVKAEFADELAEINDAIADLEETVENLENADFYKDKIQKEIDAVKEQLDEVAQKAKDEQQKIDVNEAKYAELTEALNHAQELLDAAKAQLETLPYGSTLQMVANSISNYQTQIDNAREDIENRHDQVLLTQYDNLPYGVQNLEYSLPSMVNYAAYMENQNNIATVDAELSAVRNSLNEQNYAGSVWSEIMGEINDISTELNNLRLDNTNNYNSAYENVETIKSKLAELSEQIAALGERVQTIELGDANHDGKVSNADYYTVLDIITGSVKPEPGTPEFAAADINEDGSINIADATALSNLILYGNVEGAYARAAQNVEESVVVEASQNANGTVRLALNLNNGRAYTGMQMDVVLPEGMSIVAETAGQRAENHAVYTGEFDGFTRIVVASAQNTALAGNSGAVVYIDVEGAGNADQIEFQNVLFAETNAQLAEFTVGAAVANGINQVETDSLMGKVYNMGGRMVNAVKKGINIIKSNGETKKVVVK